MRRLRQRGDQRRVRRYRGARRRGAARQRRAEAQQRRGSRRRVGVAQEILPPLHWTLSKWTNEGFQLLDE